MDKPATIVDLAKALNVSPSTVSRALNNHPSISLETKLLVQELAKKLNYQPNLNARNLLNQKSGIIGVVIPEITSYFFSMAITAIQDVVSAAGYKLIISQTNEKLEEEVKMIQEMLLLRVEGILLSATFNTQSYQHLENVKKAGIPMVIFDRDCPGFETNKVFVNVYEGAYEAVNYLLKTGAKKIAHIAGPRSILTFDQRLKAYQQALIDNDIEVDYDLVFECNGFSPEDGIEAIENFFEKNKEFDALFCVNDAVAIGAMHALRNRGLQTPKDVAVIGFDDEPYSSIYNPPISTVWQPVYDMGILSSRILLDQINQKTKKEEYRKEILKPELIIRSTTNPKTF